MTCGPLTAGLMCRLAGFTLGALDGVGGRGGVPDVTCRF